MRTGSLRISRGHEYAPAAARAEPRIGAAHVRLVEPEPAMGKPGAVEQPPSLDYQLVHDRLSALERLTRLHEQGTLSAAEFAFEKAAILRLPAEELLLRTEAKPIENSAPRARREGPSLVGRLLGWRSLMAGLVAGLGLSAYAQPAETLALLQQVGRTMGA